jgi:SAM-dependent methyltransferase
MSFWRCTRCGLYQKSCPVDTVTYTADYQADYVRARARKLRTAAARLNQLASCVSGSPLRLLDIGCSVGAIVEAAERRGWQSYGVDVSRDAVLHCRDRGLRCQVYDGFTLPYPSRFFDVVTAWHVVEHVPSVRMALEEWYRVIAPGGVLAIETPAASCWKARLLGARYRKFWPREHTYTFDRSNLEPLLFDAGFQTDREPWIGPLCGLSLPLMAYAAGRRCLMASSRWLGVSKSFVIIAGKPHADQTGFLFRRCS